MTYSRLQEVSSGARAIFPLIVGAAPFGIIFGTLAQESSLSFWGAMAFSLLVFAGSAQFVAVGLIAAGTAVPLIIFTTFVVNLRHLLYSATLVPHVSRLNALWKVAIAFFLTDEAFAASIDRYQQPDASPCKHWHYLSAAVMMYLNWVLFTWLGLTLGQLIPNAAAWGLDFAMVTTFIGMVIPYIRQCPGYLNRSNAFVSLWQSPMILTVIVAGIVAAFADPLPHQLGIMVAALAGVIAGMVSDRWRSGSLCASNCASSCASNTLQEKP